jgi:integrative and conjugative element protein (TIGR02256 family)
MFLKESAKFWRKLTKQASEKTPKIFALPEVVAFIQRSASQSPMVETGGILMGHHMGRDILVTRATDAGPDARRSRCGFLRDTEYCQKVLNKEFASSGADYLGEWHTHVIDLPRPSRGDLQTLVGIILDPDYNFPSFAMFLAVVNNQATRLLAYVASADDPVQDSSPRVVNVAQVIPTISEFQLWSPGGRSRD